MSTGLDHLLDTASVLVCAGAGGVGKTTTSAAVALAAAQRGRRVVVVTIDPARRLADAIGVSLSHHAEQVRDVGPGQLWAVMLDTSATFDDLVRTHSKDPEQADNILQNRFYRNMADALSGTQEFMAAEKLYELHHDDRFDLVVVDTPPTRNALDFLEAPRQLINFLDHRLYRVLVTPTRLGMRVASAAAQPFVKMMSRVVGGDALAEAISFFQAFDGMEAGFRQRAAAVMDLLQSPDTAYVLITSARRAAIDETRFFAAELRRQELRVSAVVANRVHPDFAPELPDSAIDAAVQQHRGTDIGGLWDNLAVLRRAVRSEQQALADLLGSVLLSSGDNDQHVACPTVPLLDHDVHDLASLGTVAQHLLGLRPHGAAG